MGILGAIITTGFGMRRSKYERQKFVTQLNSITRIAWQQTVMTGKTHRVVFDIKKRRVRVERSTGKIVRGEPEYLPVSGSYVAGEMAVPSAFTIKQLIVDGADEMARAIGGGQQITEVWFYIVPGGLAQTVIINLLDATNPAHKRQMGLVLNPFNANFAMYDSFQK